MDSQTSLNRISVLGVPVDILPPEGIEDLVLKFADGKNHQIILLSLVGSHCARGDRASSAR